MLKFKSDNAKYLTKPFAKLIYQRLNEEKVDFDLIVPVPSHAKTIKNEVTTLQSYLLMNLQF